MQNISITVKKDGTVEMLGGVHDLDLPLRLLSKRRMSTITPLWQPKRAAFKILRKLFGENGRVAAWTRQWQGPWLVRILATGEWSVFQKRADAMRWEIEKLC